MSFHKQSKRSSFCSFASVKLNVHLITFGNFFKYFKSSQSQKITKSKNGKSICFSMRVQLPKAKPSADRGSSQSFFPLIILKLSSQFVFVILVDRPRIITPPTCIVFVNVVVCSEIWLSINLWVQGRFWKLLIFLTNLSYFSVKLFTELGCWYVAESIIVSSDRPTLLCFEIRNSSSSLLILRVIFLSLRTCI